MNNSHLDELDFTQTIQERENRRTYLITYAQADLKTYPTCESFSECVLEAFTVGTSKAKVSQWATCIENHEDGGKHFHMVVKLSAPRRWNSVYRYIYDKHGISLHFSSQHCGYNAGYKYVCKDKPLSEVLHSAGHTNLSDIGSPKTKKAMKTSASNARKRRSTQTTSHSESSSSSRITKPKRLSNTEVSEFMVVNNIRRESELMSIANKRHAEGQKDIYNFIMNKTPKALSELISTTWKLQEAPQTVQRETKSRISILERFLEEDCVPTCGGEWFDCAKEVLLKNGINIYVFTSALRECIKKGRQKNTNVLLVGPTNCGKSFLLNPIELMYKSFVNPATGKYAWIGLDECEVAYLNDFRWSSEIIAWSDFLLLLEGQTVHLPRPKNQFATDMCIDRENTIPFFATSKGIIEYTGKYNMRDDRESDMMSSRWKVFTFTYQIPLRESKQLSPCPHCFSKLVMVGAELDTA